MASGGSVYGGFNRCFSFWLDFKKCMIDCDTPLQRQKQCNAFRDDYLECMKGHKAFARQMEIYAVKKAKERGDWNPSHYIPLHYVFEHTYHGPVASAAGKYTEEAMEFEDSTMVEEMSDGNVDAQAG